MTQPLQVLRRVATRPPPPPGERCDMCAAALGARHGHVVDLRSRAMLCTCRPCWLLFTAEEARLSYRSVPDRYLAFPSFALSAAQWDDLGIPVGVAFLFTHSGLGRTVAFYPSPAGATESELPLDAWASIVAANPALRVLRDDVAALLLRRTGDRFACYLVPVDACYELVGHLRRLWRGFDGGTEAHRQLEEFFAAVAARAGEPPGAAGGGGPGARP